MYHSSFPQTRHHLYEIVKVVTTEALNIGVVKVAFSANKTTYFGIGAR